MSVLGTILSVLPSVTGIIGSLFGAKSQDYVKVKIFQPTNANEDPNIYFAKTNDNRIMIYNSCGYPVHVSMENVGVESDKGYIVEDCSGGTDITDLISSHSAKYANNIRLSVNVEESKADGDHIVSLTYTGKLDRDIEGSVCIGEFVSVEALDDDFILIIHSGCTLKEISSLTIKGDGSEPARIFENVSPDAIIPELKSSLSFSEKNDVKTIVFPNAIASFKHSTVLEIETTLLCELEKLHIKHLNSNERRLRMGSEEWSFLRKGNCVKEF